MTRLAVGLLWLLHLLPLAALAAIGRGLGAVLWRLAGERRRVVRTNLRLCFPGLPEGEREALAREHFKLVTRSFLERSLAWWASEARIRRLVRIDGLKNFKALAASRPSILLVPHFVGLDLCATRLALEIDAVSIYANQKNAVLNRLLLHGRSRFGDQLLLSRQEGVRTTVKAMRAGRPFYYLPDQDYGARDAIFAPFFGVPAATITGLSRLARLGGAAAVIPCIARMEPGGQGYVLQIGEPWADFPTDDVEADTRRMNSAIEQFVLTMPAQYYWVHKRFKTRPPGEAQLY
ncbi:MAG: lipid A biosynthesis acyltransferase [Sterolibacteriaceae bacterium]|uniref:Lipid A biosynthesis acyltransferase n=1 Tax=Candidatus Methylophosphatis roskildensis TaxID=2899263 RepID=A0A9D7DWW7_9PROT|nr:lipid A biosynthesis acyltransferase [Candidatus Methylophosphatis roskildensis]MBK7235220.1 lipid A biosynthesis acyltransferase [Sterolibacteriaceae bacterium]